MRQENAAVNGAEKRHGKSEGAFRTISEVAEELDVPQHVLRFWESRFSQIRPLKRGGNRRYYRPEDVVLLYRIRDLLYKEGYTIKGVQRILKTAGTKSASSSVTGASNLAVDGVAPKAEEQQDHLSFDLPMPSREVTEMKVIDSFPADPFPSAELVEDVVLPREKKPSQGELQDILSELLDLKKLLGETIR